MKTREERLQSRLEAGRKQADELQSRSERDSAYILELADRMVTALERIADALSVKSGRVE